MFAEIWQFIVNNALVIAVAVFFFVRMFVRVGTIPVPEHPGSKVTDIKTPQEWSAALSKAKEEKQLVVVDFYATWCGPCRRASPIFGKMSVEFSDVTFLKVDCDINRDVAMDNNVKAMPTFILFKNGDRLTDIMGWNENQLRSLITKFK